MRMILFIALCIGGCALPEDQQLLNTWTGVYEVERVTYNEEGCDAEGPEIALEPALFELYALGGDEVDLVQLRECSSKKQCNRESFASIEADVATAQRISGEWHEYIYLYATAGQGMCSVYTLQMEITRDGKSSDTLRVELRNRVGQDMTAESETRCFELIDFVAQDEEACSAFKVMDGRRVD